MILRVAILAVLLGACSDFKGAGGKPCSTSGDCPFPFACSPEERVCFYCPSCIKQTPDASRLRDASADADMSSDAPQATDAPRADGPRPDGPRPDGPTPDAAPAAWRPLAAAGAPGGRNRHSATWTGTRMLVYGGIDVTSPFPLASLHAYDPATDTWTRGADAPAGRHAHTATWTGTGLLVVGGADENGQPQGGAFLYLPAEDRWVTTDPLPGGGRRAHVAVADNLGGVIVFGGNGGARPTLYFSSARTWTERAMSPAAGEGQAAVWTDDEVVFTFGGSDGAIGWRYDPAMDAWTALAPTGLLAPRTGAGLAWAGRRVVVVGGAPAGPTALYDPATATWSALPVMRDGRDPVLGVQGDRVWAYLLENDIAVLDTVSPGPTIGSGPVSGAPTMRSGAAGVWTGSELVVWGGARGSMNLADGARHRP